MAVTKELHDYVVKRDGGCFWAKVDDDHECRDQWGTPHSPRLLSKLTVDHFWLHAGGTKGKRAPDRREHLVAMCWRGNVVDTPPARIRRAQRAYSQALYPDYVEETGETGTMSAVLDAIVEERERQDAKFGPQSHPNGTDVGNTRWAEAVKDRVDEKADLGTLTWFDILDEEVAEASAEEDIERLRTELIQTAAVSVAWVEDLDRKRAA